MQTLKAEALQAIASLPDNVDMEDIMYCLHVLENIRRGREDAKVGNTMSAEEIMQDIDAW